MSDTVIRVENLGKRYTISHEQRERYTALRDVIANRAKSIGRGILWPVSRLPLPGKKLTIEPPYAGDRNVTPKRGAQEDFWALKDVSFEINQGDRVGIIGRNGAGKSTLLKLLSRIMEPTTGTITLRGRVASLLEVGTGFHPELTGRENIYLNGAILGMGKAEIKRKFDEIVDFAEIEKFLDTPVKRYSSGMYVRLAFAVAAHLEPEILLVDEVLAVGDAQFQKKCLGKMEDVSAKEGRTVLFVSHNMGAIASLCSKTCLLVDGTLKSIGITAEIIQEYLWMGVAGEGEKIWDAGIGDNLITLYGVRILNPRHQLTTRLDVQEPIVIEFAYKRARWSESARLGFQLITSDGVVVLTSEDGDNQDFQVRQPGVYRSRAEIPANLLNQGAYYLTVGAHVPMQRIIFLEKECMSFSVERTGGVGGIVDDGRRGVIRPLLKWQDVENLPLGDRV